MNRKDALLALLVVIIWGANFTVIKLGLGGVPSMLLVAIRYSLVAFPAVFIIKKPKTSWNYIIWYGLTVGVGQFSCLFYAMEIGMPAGLASIIVQLQGFISPFLSSIFFKEKLAKKQLLGFVIAAIGLSIIGYASLQGGLASIPPLALLLTIGAPVFWSTSNIISKKASLQASEDGHKLDMLSMVIWSSLIPPIPMLVLSYFIDTPQAIIGSFASLSFMSIFSAIYLALASTIFGYGVWNILISKYPLSKVAPTSLLVPVFGLLVSQLILKEYLSTAQWLGVIIILLGLIVSNVTIKKEVKNGI